MKFISKMRKKTKGFTLVEIIVVLVILAILAAFTIPTMLGFVDDAKGKALIAEAREVYVAAQATATECKGTNQTVNDGLLGSDSVEAATAAIGGASLTMQNYLDDDMTISNASTAPTGVDPEAFWTVELAATGNQAKVNKVVFRKNGYEITIDKSATGTGATVTKIS